MALPLAGIAALLGPLGKILEKVIPDPNKAREIQAELMTEMMKADSEFYKAAGSIITAEAQGESWMQRNWRPITMLTFVFIIANNYIIVPYVSWFSEIMFVKGWTEGIVEIPTLAIPDGLWGLLQIGIGGYIASRGVEKTVSSMQTGGVPLIGGKSDPRMIEDMREMRSEQKDLLAQLREAGNDR